MQLAFQEALGSLLGLIVGGFQVLESTWKALEKQMKNESKFKTILEAIKPKRPT